MSMMPCPHCNNVVDVGEPTPGKLLQCPKCYDYIEIPKDNPRSPRPYEQEPDDAPSQRRRPSEELDLGLNPENTPIRKSVNYQRSDDGGSDNSAWGWIIFILIFGVGNFILYQTTGIFLIPIRR